MAERDLSRGACITICDLPQPGEAWPADLLALDREMIVAIQWALAVVLENKDFDILHLDNLRQQFGLKGTDWELAKMKQRREILGNLTEFLKRVETKIDQPTPEVRKTRIVDLIPKWWVI